MVRSCDIDDDVAGDADKLGAEMSYDLNNHYRHPLHPSEVHLLWCWNLKGNVVG